MMQPYPAYKNAGVPWLGEIPEHWEVRRLKEVVRFNPSKSETRANLNDGMQVVFLPMENISINGEINCTEKRLLSDVWNGFTYFRRGDVVIAKITPCFENGKSAHLKMLESDFGFGTTELIVLRPSMFVDGGFLRFVTSTKYFLLLGKQHMSGAAGQQRVPLDFFKNYLISLPPPAEQKQIAAFLDWKSAQIQRLIDNKQQQMAKLKAYKQSMIHRAVTRGLNPAVKFKPSGVPWLGDIPEHWEFFRGKNLFSAVDMRSVTGQENLLSVSEHHGVTPRHQIDVTMFQAQSYVGHKLCWQGDLVINSLWAWKHGLGFSEHHGIVSSAYGVYRPKVELISDYRYFNYLLRSKVYLWEFRVRSKGIWRSRYQLTDADFLSMPILVPPPAEQKQIVEYLEQRTATIDRAINRAEQEIQLLAEYRTRLIADVVTGKLDMRAVALPPNETAH